jgi:four helix bundle protein
MVIKKFEDIISWQKKQKLTVELYDTFKDLRDYSFKDQILRAAVSISNNIAEGFDRSSDADFARFLYMATGSASETKSMIYLAERLKYIDTGKRLSLVAQLNEISKLIYGLIKSISKKKLTTID